MISSGTSDSIEWTEEKYKAVKDLLKHSREFLEPAVFSDVRRVLTQFFINRFELPPPANFPACDMPVRMDANDGAADGEFEVPGPADMHGAQQYHAAAMAQQPTVKKSIKEQKREWDSKPSVKGSIPSPS